MRKVIEIIKGIKKKGDYVIAFVDILDYAGKRLSEVSDKHDKPEQDGESSPA